MSKRIATNNINSTKRERSISESILLLFPLFLIVILLPLIIKMYGYHSGLNIYDWFTYNDQAYDYFLYYKQWLFVGICGLIIFIIIGRALMDKRTLKFNKIFIPIIIYAILAYISTIASKYKTFGFAGNFEQFENVFCLIGYVLVAYYTFIVIESEAEMKLMFNALTIGILLISMIGALQSVGIDPLSTRFMKSVIVQKGMDPKSLETAFGKGRSYATLYNPNYVGVLGIMAVSIYTVVLVYAKKVSEYILYSLVIVSSSFSMFGAQFKAGLVYIAIVFVVMIVLLRKELKHRWFIFVGVFAVMAIAFNITNNFSGGAYTDAIQGSFGAQNAACQLTKMDTETDGVSLTYNGSYLKVKVEQGKSITLWDDKNNAVTCELQKQIEDERIYNLDDSRYQGIQLGICDNVEEGGYDFYLIVNEKFYVFKYDEESNTYLYFNRYGRFCPLKTAESAVFTGHESFGSGRGYIWSRTIPLLKDYIVLGSGADSFIQAFPQYDYIAMNNYGFEGNLITKPHCMYLQIGVQTGVLSLIAFLVFFAIYCIQSLIIYFKNDLHSTSAIIGVAMFMGTIAFLFSGISNDSTICITPVFYVMVGLGLLCNHTVKAANTKQQNS